MRQLHHIRGRDWAWRRGRKLGEIAISSANQACHDRARLVLHVSELEAEILQLRAERDRAVRAVERLAG